MQGKRAWPITPYMRIFDVSRVLSYSKHFKTHGKRFDGVERTDKIGKIIKMGLPITDYATARFSPLTR